MTEFIILLVKRSKELKNQKVEITFEFDVQFIIVPQFIFSSYNREAADIINNGVHATMGLILD